MDTSKNILVAIDDLEVSTQTMPYPAKMWRRITSH